MNEGMGEGGKKERDGEREREMGKGRWEKGLGREVA